jgi:hypothetical protein
LYLFHKILLLAYASKIWGNSMKDETSLVILGRKARASAQKRHLLKLAVSVAPGMLGQEVRKHAPHPTMQREGFHLAARGIQAHRRQIRKERGNIATLRFHADVALKAAFG